MLVKDGIEEPVTFKIVYSKSLNKINTPIIFASPWDWQRNDRDCERVPRGPTLDRVHPPGEKVLLPEIVHNSSTAPQ